jgi:hypothetical protein
MIEDPIANNKNDSCFCNLAVVLDFLTLQHKNNMQFFFGLFRVKNHDFTPKNHIFSNFWGVCAPPWIRPCSQCKLTAQIKPVRNKMKYFKLISNTGVVLVMIVW